MVDPLRTARLEPEYRRFVNWEAFFFSDARNRDAFDGNPRKYCEVLTDPVTLTRFRPGTDAPTGEFGGRTWYFLSDSTRAVFAATPDSFLVPRISMVR